jgi:hypothetical protein
MFASAPATMTALGAILVDKLRIHIAVLVVGRESHKASDRALRMHLFANVRMKVIVG